MVAILEKIVLDDFSAHGECNLFHHGPAWDCLQKNYFEFHVGNLYGIVGEFGNGGAALSCGITRNTDFYEGNVYIDDQESSMEYVIKNSWYVGLDIKNTKRLFKKGRRSDSRLNMVYAISIRNLMLKQSKVYLDCPMQGLTDILNL